MAAQATQAKLATINALDANYRFQNDSTFSGTHWSNRTHTMQFGGNKLETTKADEPAHAADNFALIKKPRHNVHTMLSLLGDTQVSFSPGMNDQVSGLATRLRALFPGTSSFTSVKQRNKIDSQLMKAHKPFIGFRALCLLATVGLLANSGKPGAAANAPETSVKNLKLKVSANGRYFVDQQGKPFFYLGDTCWLLFQRLNHEELDEYLKDRVAKGFTVMQAYVIRGLGKQHPDGNSSLLGASPFIDRDPTRPNEEFFKNMDYTVDRANELGLVMGLVTAKSWHVTDHSEKIFDEKNAYTFGKFLGERYKNNAVMWFPGGDSDPGKYDAIWVAMAKGLKDGCGGSQLICYHGQGSTSSSMWFHNADWLDFNSIQSGHNFGSDSYAFVSKDYALTPAKPTVDMEPAYENHPTGADKPRVDSHKVRTQAYLAMLAGAAGHGYGSLDLFYFYKDTDGPFPKNGFQHWRTAMAYEGSRQVGYMRRLFEERPWYKMVPDQSVLASNPGGGPFRLAAARAEDRSFAVAYTPVGQPLKIALKAIRASHIKAQWYDPRTGTWKAIGQYPNDGTQEFVPPSRAAKDDWVLVLDAIR